MPGRTMLELRLGVAATPARVARAAKLLADLAEHAFPRASRGWTVVVQNKTMRVGLRAWDEVEKRASSSAQSLADFIANPSIDAPFDAACVAADLVDYCKDEIAYEPAFHRPKTRKPLRVVNREFIRFLSVVREERPEVDAGQRMRGDTVIVSPVLRVGRSSEAASVRARVVLPNLDERDVAIESRAYDSLCDAVRSRTVMNVRLRVEWVRRDGELEIDPAKTVVLGVEPRNVITSGARLVGILGEAPAVSAADLRRALDSLREGDDE